jgi:hypothetical protein
MMKKIMIAVLVIVFAGSAVAAHCLCKAAGRGDRFIRVNLGKEAE